MVEGYQNHDMGGWGSGIRIAVLTGAIHHLISYVLGVSDVGLLGDTALGHRADIAGDSMIHRSVVPRSVSVQIVRVDDSFVKHSDTCVDICSVCPTQHMNTGIVRTTH